MVRSRRETHSKRPSAWTRVQREEDETRATLRKRLSADFDLAAQALLLGYEVHDRLCKESPKRFSHLTKATCVAALTKLCNQHRSVRVLCELGLTQDGCIVARGMFETVVRITFLMRRSTTLRRVQGLPNWAVDQRLSVDDRSRLLLADICAREEKYIRELANMRRYRDSYAKHIEAAAQRAAQERQGFSAPWCQHLGKCYMCGLTLRDLASGLGLGEWYVAVYSWLSRHVHGSDQDEFLEIVNNNVVEPKLHPDEETTTLPLDMSTCFLLRAVRSTDSRWHLECAKQIEDLSRRSNEHTWAFDADPGEHAK